MAVLAVEDGIGHYQQARLLLQEQKPQQHLPPASEVDHLYACLERAISLQKAYQQAKEAYEELVATARQKPVLTTFSKTLHRLAILTLQQSFDKPGAHALLEEAWHIAQISHD